MNRLNIVFPKIVLEANFSIDMQINPNIKHWDNRIASKFYPVSSLEPDTYLPQFFLLEEETSNEQLVAFAEKEGLSLPGAKGIALIARDLRHFQGVPDFKEGKAIVFPDIKERLYKKDGAWRVPYMQIEQGIRLHVMKWKSSWYSGTIVCYFKKI